VGGSTVRGMANFAVRLVHGPNWDAGRPIRGQDGWGDHAAFMDGLVDDGFVILGGPVGDGTQTLHAVEAADEDEIRARLALDPWGFGRAAPGGADRALGVLARRPALTGTLGLRPVRRRRKGGPGGGRARGRSRR
jgi:hypothetical protein